MSEQKIGYDKALNRQSNFELMRIAAMIMIVAHHFSVHGGFDFNQASVTFNQVWIQFLRFGGKIGVDIFVLLSGYFLVTAKKLNIKKIIRFWGQVFFYSVIFFIVFLLIFRNNLTTMELIKNTIKDFMPITFRGAWFASTYFVLYLLSPYINRLIYSLDKRALEKLLLLMTVLWCILPTITTEQYQSNTFIIFVYLYILAGYLRLYDNKIINAKTAFGAAALISLLSFSVTLICDFFGVGGGREGNLLASYATYLYEINTIPTILISLCIFIGFKNLKVKNSKIINKIASATFGVYLIHDNVHMREILWSHIFRCSDYSNSKLLVLYSIFVITVVFLTGTIIELIRIKIVEKQYIKFIDWLEGAIKKSTSAKFQKVIQFFK